MAQQPGGGAPVQLAVGQASTVGQAVPYMIAGIVMLPLLPYLMTLVAGTDAAVARALLAGGPTDPLRAELRELIHGIQPQILTDLGLPAALDELADQSPIPVTVDSRLDGRLPGHVENTAYFAAAEALTNIAKHSGATSATVTARLHDGVLAVEITDNGHGGATQAPIARPSPVRLLGPAPASPDPVFAGSQRRSRRAGSRRSPCITHATIIARPRPATSALVCPGNSGSVKHRP
jgi:hypothetical protein